MSVFLKGFAALAVLSVLAYGGLRFSNYLSNQIIIEKIVNVSSLNKEDDFNNISEYSTANKVGKEYAYFMVGTYKEDNENWWKVSYRRYLKVKEELEEGKEFSDLFKDLEKPFEERDTTNTNHNNQNKALNKACELVYKKLTTEIETNGGNKRKIKEDLWSFCSDLKHIPVMVSDEGEDEYKDKYTENQIGEKKKTELLSVRDPSNDKLWAWKNEQFFNTAEDEIESKYFKGLRELNLKRNYPLALKEKCAWAYKTEPAADEQPESEIKFKEDTIKNYCSLTLKTTVEKST